MRGEGGRASRSSFSASSMAARDWAIWARKWASVGPEGWGERQQDSLMTWRAARVSPSLMALLAWAVAAWVRRIQRAQMNSVVVVFHSLKASAKGWPGRSQL